MNFALRAPQKYANVEEDITNTEDTLRLRADSDSEQQQRRSQSQALLVAIAVLNAVYCCAEFVAAVHFNSSALLIDAFHNMGDVGNTLIALYCERAKFMSASSVFSFGRERMEVIGAMINACTLLALSLYTVLDCLHGLLDPHPMKMGTLYLVVAALGLPVNLISACLAIRGGARAFPWASEV